jgi:hypothetical protein
VPARRAWPASEDSIESKGVTGNYTAAVHRITDLRLQNPTGRDGSESILWEVMPRLQTCDIHCAVVIPTQVGKRSSRQIPPTSPGADRDVFVALHGDFFLVSSADLTRRRPRCICGAARGFLFGQFRRPHQAPTAMYLWRCTGISFWSVPPTSPGADCDPFPRENSSANRGAHGVGQRFAEPLDIGSVFGLDHDAGEWLGS